MSNRGTINVYDFKTVCYFVNVGNYVHLNNHQNLIYSLSNQGAINVCDFFKHFVNFVNVGNYVHLNNHHSQCV